LRSLRPSVQNISHMNPDWHFGANDPDPIGWLIFFAYLITSSLCVASARRSAHLPSCPNSTSARLLWWSLATLMLFLGVNKQLDLQTPFIALGKNIAIAEGWYQKRRMLKWVFTGFVGVAGAGFLAWTASHARHGWSRHALPLSGVAILITFVLLEAAPLHHANAFDSPDPGFDKRQILELLGIACIGVSALLPLRRQPDLD